MHGRRLFALSVVAVAFGCQDQMAPTAPAAAKAPPDPSAIISDGAHCGPAGSIPACNPDFFFLPPMVPLPLHNANFELGKFNKDLKSSLTIEICELRPTPGLPTGATGCVGTDRFEPGSGGTPLKTFAPGTVKLVNLPVREFGWWTLFGLPPDGFYYVLWDTRQSNLSTNKFYRIKVFLKGSRVPLGIADVDPMSSLREWKFTRTGEVVQLIDDFLLPIPFRVEKGGGPALCGQSILCTSATITNLPAGSPDQIIRVQGADGSYIAGVRIPPEFLPQSGPQSVVLTIRGVNTGANNLEEGTQQYPCHASLPLQQFNSCFHFSTIPELDPIPGGAPGHELDQFLKAITVAVCFVLHDTDHWQEPWVQLWSSDEGGANAKALQSTSVAGILTGATGQTCGSNLLGFDNRNSNSFTRFASAGWQKVKSGFSQLFGVQTAYAVDFGIGGLAFDLSFIGPALSARITPTTSTEIAVAAGTSVTSTVRVQGTKVHSAGAALNTGIDGMPVIFTLSLLESEEPLVTDTVTTDEGGFASLDWIPTEAGSYTLTAVAKARGGPVTFDATVTADLGIIDFENYPPGAGVCNGAGACPVTNEFASRGVVFSFSNTGQTASLCRTIHGPAGEGSNYGVSPQSTDCTGWNSGTVTMSFASYPTTVEFTLEGNNLAAEGPFAATALDATGAPVTVTRLSFFTYPSPINNTFRREVRRVSSPNGIASVAVNSAFGVLLIDNLLIGSGFSPEP
jgi:hypothetical protein